MKYLAVFLAAVLGIAATPLAAQDSTKGKTILILDASGSMWGKIEGKAKIEIALATAADLIKNRPANLEMGLMAYGHRRKGDCDDIELIVAPGKETTESLLGALDRMVPKGKTPIFKSVLQAAESLRYTEQPASVILVSDGIETCGGDLDALGKLLAEKGIDFKTHIIGFAMTDAQTVELRALARTTGGLYADAGDAATLKAALQTAVAAAVKPVTSLSLVPLDEDGKSILKNGVTFAFYKNKGDENPAAKGSGGLWKTDVEPGAYHATATFAGRTLEAAVDAAEGRNTTHHFTFKAPVLTLQAAMQEGGEALTDGVAWNVLGAANAEGKRPPVSYSYDATATFRLAPGDYLVKAKRGNATVEKEITFGEEPQTVTLIFGAGTLAMSASLTEGGEAIASGLAWRVLGEPNSEGKRPQVAFSYDAKPKFTVPAGAYLVSVKKGNATATTTVEVGAGKETTGHIVIGSGFLKPRAVMSAGMEPFDDKGLKWDVLSEPNDEGKRKSVAFSYDAEPRFSIPSGSYLLRVTRGKATAEQDVVVDSGKTTEVVLNLSAALLRPTVSMAKGGEVFDDRGLKWEIFSPPNAEGKRTSVAFSYDAQPTFVLPVGGYQVVVKRESATATLDDVAVVAGKLNTAHVVLNAGLIKLILADASGTPVSGKHWWDVFTPPNAEGKRTKVAYSNKPTPTIALGSGPYLVKGKAGDQTAEAEITVAAGKLTEFTVKLPE